ncbi:MAG: DEAD/DEAH box helicase [Ktedonobacteraceae bacterium]
MTRELWPHQKQALADIRRAFGVGTSSPGFRRVCYQLPTGGGKTDIMCQIAKGCLENGLRVRMDTHRRELVDQIVERLGIFGITPGIIAAGYPNDIYAQCQVASIDTYIRRLGQYERFDIIFRDECHHAPSPKWRNSLDGDASHVLGVSATPRRLDGRPLSDDYDVIICGPTVPELIAAGFLVQPLVYAPPIAFDRDALKMRGGDFAKDDLTEALEKSKAKIFGDAIRHYKEICPGTAAIAFCHSVKAAQEFAEKCNEAGIPAASINGEMNRYERSMHLDNLKSGAISVLANCELLGEGVDVPRVEACILLRPTASESLCLQQIGRALRADKERGKTCAYILDHVGNVLEHGLPDEPRTWSLEGKAPRKRKDGVEVAPAITTCRNCFAMFRPAPVCPRCGTAVQHKERKFEMVDGQLMLITDPALLQREERRIAKEKLEMELRKAESLTDFIDIAKSRNYEIGWARMQYNMRNKWKRKKA